MTATRSLATLALAAFLTAGCSATDMQQVAAIAASMPGVMAPGGGQNTQMQIAAGLKEALRVGTSRASTGLAQTGGFSNDPILRLNLPQELQGPANALRAIGMGSQVDALESSMNRAAERAAGEAVPVFTGAITSMTLQDVQGIFQGGNHAATDYFRQATGEQLRQRFAPIVETTLNEVGVYKAYRDVVSRYEALPLMQPVQADLTTHVTDRAMEGLFSRLATEEAKIRNDPAARTTALLRQVFGQPGQQ